MHYSTTAVVSILLAAGASAQQTTTATVLVPYALGPSPVISVVGNKDSRTTYSLTCNSAAVSSAVDGAKSLASKLGSLTTLIPTAVPSDLQSLAGAAKSALSGINLDRRGFPLAPRATTSAGSSDDDILASLCPPYTIVQGPSTWEYHLTIQSLVTADVNCNFGSGGILSADATCTGKGLGDLKSSTTQMAETTTVKASDMKDFQKTVTVTAASGVSLPTAGAGSAGKTGAAAPFAVPTGAVAMMAGAGGILAAALAL